MRERWMAEVSGAAARDSEQGSAKWRRRAGDRLLTTAEAARVLGLTKNGVRWLASVGRLDCDRTVGGWRLFRYAEVLDVLHAQAETRLAPRRCVIVAEARATQLPLPIGAPGARSRLAAVRPSMLRLPWRAAEKRNSHFTPGEVKGRANGRNTREIA